ncbi:MAG: YdcH family protein [Candidatus Aminicenantes bacterium]|nr:YdcH family protein [Candidatus Aminicenantes bacterium]
MDEKEIRERLLREDVEFKRIFEEHRRQDEQLAALRNKSLLTDQEKFEESELKKRKLALKDKMYQMMSDYRKSL